MSSLENVWGLGGLAVGALISYGVLRWQQRAHRAEAARRELAILDDARRQADAIAREARVQASEAALKLREETERSFAARREEIALSEKRLVEREARLNHQLEELAQDEKKLREHQADLQRQLDALESERQSLALLKQKRREELQAAARLSEADARQQLLKDVENEALSDASDLSRRILDEAKTRAEEKARRIITTAIQRYAGDHTFENTSATIALQGEDIKGRIIGREGRNIRAFELATGVTVMIDDTPNTVVLSGFDPVRREIARESMQRLVLDGRIHPTRIEEVVAKVTQEMDETVLRSGESAVSRAGLPPMHPEIVKVLGKLRFRHSFAQNVLDHSVEVAHLMGLMAAELGLDTGPAKRAGLLHDIGKALNQEIEGAHALVGAEFIQRFGETEEVINAVASHHRDVEPHGPLGVLVSAADAISASRPGARSETMATYIKRVEDLEKVGRSFPGVEKCFAVQAGRELRVIVFPDQVPDEQAFVLARNISRKIEEQLAYPGQIRVTVVREMRCVEFAK